MSGQVTRCGTCQRHDLPCGAGVHRNPLMHYLEHIPATHITPDMVTQHPFVPVIVPVPQPPDPRWAEVADRHERAARRANRCIVAALAVLMTAGVAVAVILPLLVLGYTLLP